MYDLEVSHPKHNFLLPNGIVTSNSETPIHFYPSDKRKLYRANKLVRRHGADYEQLSEEINKRDDDVRTTPTELAGLMAAASCVSADSVGGAQDVDAPDAIARFAAPESARPDVQFEMRSTFDSLVVALEGLTTFEKKLLRLVGVSLGGLSL